MITKVAMMSLLLSVIATLLAVAFGSSSTVGVADVDANGAASALPFRLRRYGIEREPNPPFPLPSAVEVRRFVSATLGSNMVLQRDRPVMLWGFSSLSGSSIKTTIRYRGDNVDDLVLSTKASSNPGESGIWRQALPPHPASLEPVTIIIQGSAPNEQQELTNVLFGDVYLCGGQSNMQFSMPAVTNSTIEAKTANKYPHIRLFTVGQGTASQDKALADLQTIEQNWTVADEHSIAMQGGQNPRKAYFSSVCWFFGREISDGLQNTVPIGLISNNWGGTKVELWQPNGTLYNAMIHPYTIGPMGLTGFAWYQGEANTYDQASADAYSKNIQSMIRSWRDGFHMTDNNDGYFGFVQLSTWCGKNLEAIPQMREAQMKALDLPYKIGYATNADHGFGCNIHPPSKQYCGRRLGRSALALQYNQKLHWKSPSYRKGQRLSSTVVRSNTHGMDPLSAEVTVSVVLEDVSSDGLYLLNEAFNTKDIDFHFDCSKQAPGICAYPSILLNDGEGWRNATVDVSGNEPNKVTFRTTVEFNGENENLFSNIRGYHVSVLATSYGWGGVPIMTLYDSRTNLPVLPWKEKASGGQYPERRHANL